MHKVWFPLVILGGLALYTYIKYDQLYMLNWFLGTIVFLALLFFIIRKK